MQRARREREAAAVIEKLGGGVQWSKPSGPSWLRSLLGDDLFQHVETVFCNIKDTDAALEHIKPLNEVENLLLDWTEVTDAGLMNLKDGNQLHGLGLQGTQVTDAGLENLKELSQLRSLDLSGTKITDAGLAHLKALNKLEYLRLAGTQVTDAGVENLKGLNHLQMLDLDFTHVTDAGLEHLKGLDQLQTLWLTRAKITNTGVKKLQQALPNCQIQRGFKTPESPARSSKSRLIPAAYSVYAVFSACPSHVVSSMRGFPIDFTTHPTPIMKATT
jgi:hypothetical protein